MRLIFYTTDVKTITDIKSNNSTKIMGKNKLDPKQLKILLIDFINNYKNDKNIIMYNLNINELKYDCEMIEIEKGWWSFCDWIIGEEEKNVYSISYSKKGLFKHETVLIIYFSVERNGIYRLKDWTIKLID